MRSAEEAAATAREEAAEARRDLSQLSTKDLASNAKEQKLLARIKARHCGCDPAADQPELCCLAPSLEASGCPQASRQLSAAGVVLVGKA